MRLTTDSAPRRLTWVLLSLLLLAVGGLFLPVDRVLAAMGDAYGSGDWGVDTMRVVQASHATAVCTTADLVSGSDTAVLAVRAGRVRARVQVVDIDGAARCAPGAASTNGLLANKAANANEAGQTVEFDGWGGAVNCRAVVGATTITVNVCEEY